MGGITSSAEENRNRRNSKHDHSLTQITTSVFLPRSLSKACPHTPSSLVHRLPPRMPFRVFAPPTTPPTFAHWSVAFTTCRPTYCTAGAAAAVHATIAASHPWNYRRGTRQVYADARLRRCQQR